MSAVVLLSDTKVLVDECDLHLFSSHTWSISKTKTGNYVLRIEKGVDSGSRETVYLHRFLMGLRYGDKAQVDHINGNPMDNRRANLRVCTRSQNQLNRAKPASNKTGIKGVSWDKKSRKWYAKARSSSGRQISIGRFENIDDAAEAYRQYILAEHGEFANPSL